MKLTIKQLILGMAILSISVSIYMAWQSPVMRSIKSNRNINFILVGTDWVDYSQHSDTLMFVSYNPRLRLVDLISLPRDTRLSIPELHINRINEAYAYYYKKNKNHTDALQAICKIVSMLLGNRVELNYYFQVDYDSFRKFIDAIGGVTIEIEDPMNYDDNAGNLHISFTPGQWVLYGKKAVDLTNNKTYTTQGALEYVRFRGSAGDIGRIYRQQRFFKAVLNRLKNPSIILRAPSIARFIVGMHNTNFSLWDIACMLFEFKNLDFGNVRMAQLPGNFSSNYWMTDSAEVTKILDVIYGPEIDFNKPMITVEVLNASDYRGAALEITRKLRNFGFDVIDYSNYPTRQLKTIVIDRVGNLKAAQSIASILATDEIFTRYDSKRLVDISVIIGNEYKRSQSAAKPLQMEEEEDD